ncbi:MAG: sigma-54-dependent Fis family transcriptional regulator [Nitrospirae bacterium]|nr:sigma-54-dependent Fis family transcriptional regulator [Nitrospirota bacterium]
MSKNSSLKSTVLIIEDMGSMASMLEQTITAEGYRTILTKDGTDGIRIINEEKVDLVITDLKLPGKDGLEILRSAKEKNPLIPVILITAFGSIETAVSAMKEGAYEFLTKPFDTDHLLVLIKRALENQKIMAENILLKEEFGKKLGFPKIIGKSPAMEEVSKNIQKVAPTKTTVLLLGESGTGKELFARALHHLSPRKDNPFVAINCAAIPRELLESELFGHEKGAFTGADHKRIGKFELADKGSIFFDEIGEMDMTLQAKLLRALQGEAIERVGGIRPIPIDVRIIAASNRDLEKAVLEKRFREDLYYRVNVFPIKIPPLKERGEDISLLVNHFINYYCAELKTNLKGITSEALDILKNHTWKGNVRELENCIERAVILCDGKTILPEHLVLSPSEITDTFLQELSMEGGLEEVSKAAIRTAEIKLIKKVLNEVGGNKTKAAQILKVSYKTLLTKIRDYGI